MLSLQSFMGAGPGPQSYWHSAPANPADCDAIRRAMRQALEGAALPPRHRLLPLRIEHAADIQALWYLRTELMQALAASHGELRAAGTLVRISGLFHDMLPPGLAASLAPRPGRRRA